MSSKYFIDVKKSKGGKIRGYIIRRQGELEDYGFYLTEKRAKDMLTILLFNDLHKKLINSTTKENKVYKQYHF